MDEEQEASVPSDPWVWQGFFGPMAAAVAGKAITDELPGEIAGVKKPLPGEPPMFVDTNGVLGMFAIGTRPEARVPCPEGLMEADRALVGRMVAG